MLQILRRDSAYSQRLYRAYDLDGVPTIGVLPGEPFAVQVQGPHRRIKALVSVDGTNTRTAKPAIDSPDEPGYLADNGGVLVSNWQEDMAGGAGLVFTLPERSVVTHTTGGNVAAGYISVMVYCDAALPGTHPTGFTGGDFGYTGIREPQLLKEPLYREERPRSFRGADEAGAHIQVGAGGRVHSPLRGGRELINPQLLGFYQVRYLSLEQLRAHPGLPFSGHPVGFLPAPMANLAGVPREGGEAAYADSNLIRMGLLRFSN